MSALEISQAVHREMWDSATDKSTLTDSDLIQDMLSSAKRCWKKDV